MAKQKHGRKGTIRNPVKPIVITDERGFMKDAPANATFVAQYLKDGSASNMNVDGGTPKLYLIQPASSDVMVITKFVLQLFDAGAFAWGTFGFITALGNGCLFAIKDDNGVIFDLLNAEKLQTNQNLDSELGCLDIVISTPPDMMLSVEFDTKKVFGEPIILDGANNQRLVFTIQDNLTALTDFRIKAFGYKYTP